MAGQEWWDPLQERKGGPMQVILSNVIVSVFVVVFVIVFVFVFLFVFEWWDPSQERKGGPMQVILGRDCGPKILISMFLWI